MGEGFRRPPAEMQAVILAGGEGKRMGELTRDAQKCMLEVEGAPILSHILSGIKKCFGRRVDVIIATGHMGNDVRRYFGDTFDGIKLSYAHDARPLETKRRMLLAKDLIVRPFFFLAGDVLTPHAVLEQIAARFEREQAMGQSRAIGVLSGATDHSPALTHAVLSVSDGYLKRITHPPPESVSHGELRETHRAIYSLDFLRLVEQSSERLMSNVIDQILRDTDKTFGVEAFEGPWAHYADPNDLETYQCLSFLNDDENLIDKTTKRPDTGR